MIISPVLSAILGVLAIVGCRPPVDPPPVDDCEMACRHARALGCELGELTPRGGSCEDGCRNAREAGIDLGVACVRNAGTCEVMDRCMAR